MMIWARPRPLGHGAQSGCDTPGHTLSSLPHPWITPGSHFDLPHRSAPAPWAEFETDKIIITVPADVARSVGDPEGLMEWYDRVSGWVGVDE